MDEKITFEDLEQLLSTVGFTLSTTSNSSKIFTHASTDAVVVLPNYIPDESIGSAHLAGVRRTLVGKRVLEDEAFDEWLESFTHVQPIELATISVEAEREQLREIWQSLALRNDWSLVEDEATFLDQAMGEARALAGDGQVSESTLRVAVHHSYNTRLYRGLQTRDERAAHELWLAAFRLLLHAGWTQTEAEDMAQETVVQAIEKLSALRSPQGLLAWLIMLVRTVERDFRRRQQGEESYARVDRPSLTEQVESSVISDAINAGLEAALPDALERIVVLRTVLVGDTSRNVARDLGLPETHIRLAKARAIQRLRRNPDFRTLLEQLGAVSSLKTRKTGHDIQDDRLRRCKEAVEAQCREHRWGLTPQQQDDYANGLLEHMPAHCLDSLLWQIAWCYHHDHQLVMTLQSRDDLDGQIAWEHCRAQLPALLHYARLQWNIDSSSDQEDLCQIGALAIFEALPQFHYHSRFSTWMYQVFRHSVLRAIRDRKAGKRFGPTASYNEQPTLEPTISAEMAVESTAQFKALIALIDEILAADQDQRLRLIFRLWAFNDARLADIGRITGLSQSRVSILLEQARKRLRQDPRMQGWSADIPAQIPPTPSSPSAVPAGTATASDVGLSNAMPAANDDLSQISKDTN